MTIALGFRRFYGCGRVRIDHTPGGITIHRRGPVPCCKMIDPARHIQNAKGQRGGQRGISQPRQNLVRVIDPVSLIQLSGDLVPGNGDPLLGHLLSGLLCHVHAPAQKLLSDGVQYRVPCPAFVQYTERLDQLVQLQQVQRGIHPAHAHRHRPRGLLGDPVVQHLLISKTGLNLKAVVCTSQLHSSQKPCGYSNDLFGY